MPLPLLVAAAPAILSAGKGIYDMISGGSKYNKAKKEMDALATPFYKIQNEYTQNRDIAANRAGQGYGDAQLDYLTNENERGLGAGISALSQGGGTGANDLAKILDTYSRTASRTAAEDAALQTENIARFMGANKDLAGQKTIQWHENEYQPWANKQSLLAGQMKVGKQTQDAGWNSTISGISGALSAFQNQDLLPKKTTPIGGTDGYGFTPSLTESTAFQQTGATSMNPTPQQVSGRNSVYDQLMNGGMKLSDDKIPLQSAARPFKYEPQELNFDVLKNIWK